MRRAWVEIDLGALRHNAAAIAERAGTPILPMVKADGYGLGAIPVARALEPLAPWGFGTATLPEGVALREAGVERPLVVFTPLHQNELPDARRWRLTPCFGSARQVSRWTELGGGPWHLSIDTGMNRDGVRWDEVRSVLQAVDDAPPEGAFTHFHSADRDDESMQLQEQRFDEAVAALPRRPRVLHAENSAALVRRQGSPWDIARPGIFLYGAGTRHSAEIAPRPVVRLRARIVDLHTVPDGETVSYAASYRARGERRIATVALGYGDGYPRTLGNRGAALIGGCRVPVAGVVNMDMVMLDVTGTPCEVGDVATFIGADGNDTIGADDAARAADTIAYELFTRLSGRLERVYSGGSA